MSVWQVPQYLISISTSRWPTSRRSTVVGRSGSAGETAAEPKELHVVHGAGHVDLYDKTDLIPFDKLDEFFTKNLA
ncbi:hypothetical protein ACH47Z_43815 [Streptomyces sp. NPDC020192]|uniref:hypothetical protein n=1 Tax=Streptomyces sp. NPDC020192 TaxID=3365066 RepID=UPI00378A8066